MTTPYLPAECLRKIFDEFKDDKEDLHSCLLVNRHWCRNIIDLLWRKPFRFLYTCKKDVCQCINEKLVKRQCQAYNLLETYLSCFMFNEELKFNTSLQEGKKPTYKRTMFNYIQYLQYIDFEELHSAIIDWIQFAAANSKNTNTYYLFGGFLFPIWNWLGFSSTSLSYILSSSSNNDYSILLFKHLAMNVLNCKQPLQNNDQLLNEWLAAVICKLLMRNKKNSLKSISICELVPGQFRCKYLDRFHFPHTDDDLLDYDRLPESYFILPIFEDSSNCFSNLVEFICTSRQRKQNLLNSLAKVSKNLSKIIISVEYDNYYYWLENSSLLEEVNSLANLIQVQNSLSHFEIYRCPVGFELIILSLKKHLNSLKFIRLVEVKVENFDLLNIVNDSSYWEVTDLDVSRDSNTFDTEF